MFLDPLDANTIRMTAKVYGGKGWTARITGPDLKYGLARDFLRKTDLSTGHTTYRELEWLIPLVDGAIYEYSYQHIGGRTSGFWRVADGELVDIERSDLWWFLDAAGLRRRKENVMRYHYALEHTYGKGMMTEDGMPDAMIYRFADAASLAAFTAAGPEILREPRYREAARSDQPIIRRAIKRGMWIATDEGELAQ